ncbi:MAG: hypothetical protein FJZ01_05705 [Candidatus Sericytochromatia bacterium]|nr:hypothetical protein [Candidatus Tanganyikabacteria bacterium]
MRMTNSTATWLGAALALAVAGCHVAPTGDPAPAKGAPGSSSPPTEAAGAIAAADVVVPYGFTLPLHPSRIQEVAGSVAMTGSVVGSGSVAINDAFVYFTSPDEKYYVARSSESETTRYLVAVRTDHAGNFATPGVFPSGQAVVANALLARNRRLVGFGVAGAVPARITIGSTFAFEFFRDTVGYRKLDAAALLSRDEVRQTIVGEGERADAIMAESGADPDAELTIGNGAVLGARYVARALAGNGPTFRAWSAVFPGLYALTTLAGTFNLADNEPTQAVNATSLGLHGPAGVVQGPVGDDAIYIAERDGWHVKRVAPDGSMTVIAGKLQGRDPSVLGATYSADATPLANAFMPMPYVHTIAADAKGNLAVTFKGLDMVGFICRSAGTYFGRAMAKDALYYLSAPDGKPGWVEGAPEAGVPKARFREPNGMTFDDQGNLYVCDRRNNLIRRIAASSGEVETVLGDGWPFLKRIREAADPKAPDAPPGTPDTYYMAEPSYKLTRSEVGLNGVDLVDVTDYGRLVDQPAGSGNGLKASFNRPLQIAWRKNGADKQDLFVYDGYNNVIRRASTGYPGGSFKDAAVETFAGQTQEFTSDKRPYTVTIGRPDIPADGKRREVAFRFATYNPDDKSVAQVVTGGMALDAANGRLYVADTNNRAIRVIELTADKVATLAKNDPTFAEGDAGRAVLSNGLAGMAVLRGGDLVFCDQANHVVRRIHLRHSFQ